MRRREEKRRAFHEALLQTLYPPSSPLSSPSNSPSSLEAVDDKPFDVTLINPEDYVEIGSSNHGNVNENGAESETEEKPSRAKRKKLRKKMLKEEAARRKKVIGPLLPTDMLQIPDERRVREEDAGESNTYSQLVRPNAQEKTEEKIGGNNTMRKVKKRREAKKLAKECQIQDPTPEKSNS